MVGTDANMTDGDPVPVVHSHTTTCEANSMTFLEAAKAILAEAGVPLSANEITRRALERGLIVTKGDTPDATMRAQLGTALQRHPDEAEVVKVGRGMWGLRGWETNPPAPEPEPTPPIPSRDPKHWFLVTNPEQYDAEELFAKDTEIWGESIRSPLVRKRIRDDMRAGDRALVYRGKPLADVFCEVEIVSDPHPRGDTLVFDVKAVRRLEPPVPLAALRACDDLSDVEFLRNPRISISPLSPSQFEAIGAMVGQAGVKGEEFSHDLVQWQLIRLAEAFRCDCWVAQDCRNRECEGGSFADHCIGELPNLGFDQETVNLIRGIDVLWLRGSSILAAFEIEHTTSIYSGILRLSDLVALQPNINIDLFIVAPTGRRTQVMRQLGRPTFHRLPRPLHRVCKLITYESLGDLVRRVEAVAGFVQVDLIKTVAEACEG